MDWRRLAPPGATAARECGLAALILLFIAYIVCPDPLGELIIAAAGAFATQALPLTNHASNGTFE